MKILVTGAGGFLGKAIAKMLVHDGHEVWNFSRKNYEELSKYKVSTFLGDLAKYEDVRRATKGMDAIIHVAAQTGMWGRYDSFYRTNVVGTANIIQASWENKVQKIVYTSTPSVVFGNEDICGANESIPYPRRYISYYAETKALAEKMILSANDGKNLCTVALRPHLIWGPGEPHMIPRLIERAKSNKLSIVGNGSNLVDVTFVDNAALAHCLALENLIPGAQVCGKAYFIGQERPVVLWDFINTILSINGVNKIERKIPFWSAYALGEACEMYNLLIKQFDKEPLMTRFIALQMARSHYFCHDEAKADFEYEARTSIEDGLKALTKS